MCYLDSMCGLAPSEFIFVGDGCEKIDRSKCYSAPLKIIQVVCERLNGARVSVCLVLLKTIVRVVNYRQCLQQLRYDGICVRSFDPDGHFVQEQCISITYFTIFTG